MEFLPHLWISFYHSDYSHIILQRKKIKYIIHLSKTKSFFKTFHEEQIRIPLEYNDTDNYEEKNNILYQHLFDITDYIHQKIIHYQHVLLIGYEERQEIDTILVAYLIRYGKIDIHHSIQYLKSKKKDVFEPKCFYYYALQKFYTELNK